MRVHLHVRTYLSLSVLCVCFGLWSSGTYVHVLNCDAAMALLNLIFVNARAPALSASPVCHTRHRSLQLHGMQCITHHYFTVSVCININARHAMYVRKSCTFSQPVSSFLCNNTSFYCLCNMMLRCGQSWNLQSR